jgi:type II secretory pathway pseudopilin PulG
MSGASHRRAKESGLVMLALLLALALASIALLAGLDVWALEKQRMQEEELLFIGNQYRLAIQRYYLAGRTLPQSIDDLLEDKRFPIPLHHLRRAYADPMTGKTDWHFLLDGDRFYGVYSSSDRVPIKHANFPHLYEFFANAQTYADWKFFYPPPGLRSNATTGAPSTPNQTSPFVITPRGLNR